MWLSKESCNKTSQPNHWKRDKPRLKTLGRHYWPSFHIPEAETGGSETFELYSFVLNGMRAKSTSFENHWDSSWIVLPHLSRGLLHRRVFRRKNEFELLRRKNQGWFWISRWEMFLLVLFTSMPDVKTLQGLNCLKTQTQIPASQWQAHLQQQIVNLKNIRLSYS